MPEASNETNESSGLTETPDQALADEPEGATVEPETLAAKAPDYVANLCQDIQARYNLKEPSATAMIEDLKNPDQSPQFKGDGDHDRVVRAYREEIEDLLALRQVLDMSGVVGETPPDPPDEDVAATLRQYGDKIAAAHQMRRVLL